MIIIDFHDEHTYPKQLLESLLNRSQENAVDYLLEQSCFISGCDAAVVYTLKDESNESLFPIKEYVKNSNLYPLSTVKKAMVTQLPLYTWKEIDASAYGDHATAIAFALHEDNQLFGALVLIHQTDFMLQNEQALDLITSCLSTYLRQTHSEKIQLSTAFKEERIRRQQSDLMRLMKDARLTSIDLLPAFEMICESAVDTLQVDRVSIWFYNDDQTSLICQSLYDSTLQSFQDTEPLHEEYYPDYFSALEKNRSIVVNDTHSDDRVRELSDYYLSKLNIRAMMDIPIISGGQTLGVLCCEQYGDSRGWSFDEEAYATSIGDMVAFINEHVKRRDAEQEAKKLAYYDALTDLPNRNLMEEKLDEKIEESNGYFAFFYLDIDDFAKVNEHLGYRIGDQLLMAIAKRLKSERSPEDVIGRLDHDGFVVLTGFSDEKSHVYRSIQHYQQLFHQPFRIEGQDIFITVSTGVVLYPEGGDNPGTIMRNSHRANAVAKHEGLSSTKFYEHAYDDYAFEDQWFHMNLKQALENNEFCLYYQPQVNIETMEVTGLEALIRWNHPSKGQISPQEFIPFAEVTGLIVPLGEWILRQAVDHILLLEHNGFEDVRISVNISPEQFKHPDFIDTLTTILSERSVSPSKLRLEITETMAINHEAAVIDRLHKLGEIGVTVALDDFGTGYSSLKHLSLFPIHCLKIDRSFIEDITSNVKNEAIVRTTIDLADNLHLEVVAEGVESKEVVHHLQQLGNQTIQGYYFSKPMPTDQLLPWMESFTKS